MGWGGGGLLEWVARVRPGKRHKEKDRQAGRDEGWKMELPRDTVCYLSPATYLSFGCARGEDGRDRALLNRTVGSALWDGMSRV
jgi:hypothetical protein